MMKKAGESFFFQPSAAKIEELKIITEQKCLARRTMCFKTILLGVFQRMHLNYFKRIRKLSQTFDYKNNSIIKKKIILTDRVMRSFYEQENSNFRKELLQCRNIPMKDNFRSSSGEQ